MPAKGTGHVVRAVYSVLDSNRSWWLTTGDLALWVYGEDTVRECRLVRTAIIRLRALGHPVERRRATWVPSRREDAYRLRKVTGARIHDDRNGQQ